VAVSASEKSCAEALDRGPPGADIDG